MMWHDDLEQLISEQPAKNAILKDLGALSTALRQKYRDLTVEIIVQMIGTATYDEQQILSIDENNCYIREVYLCGNGKRIVHARVIAPNKTYLQFKAELDNLGNKFLGEDFIYKRPYIRSNFQFSKTNDKISRRSIFTFDKCKLLVVERFLDL